MRKSLFILLVSLISVNSYTQSITISPGTNENPAMINTSNDYQRGYKIPTMTSVERLNLVNAVDGLMVFDQDRKNLCTYYTSTWYCASNDVITDRKPQTVFASDSTADDGFGRAVSLDTPNNRAAVGALNAENGSNTNQGAVYLYSYSTSSKTWSQTQKLVAADGQANDNFGKSVILKGDYLIVGATGCNSNTGAVYVFKRVSGVWTQEAKIIPSDASTGDLFGSSIDFLLNTAVTPNVPMVIASSPGDDLVSPSVAGIGSFYVYTYNSTTFWTLFQKIMESSGQSNEGSSMVVRFKDASTILSGKRNFDISPNINNGKIQMYRNTSSSFALVQTINGGDLAYLGQNIEISGNLVLVGGQNNNPGLYVYNTTTNLLSTSVNPIVTARYDIYFGVSLAIDDDKILVLDTYEKFGEFFKVTTSGTNSTDVSFQTIGLPNFRTHLYGNARISTINNGLYLIGEADDLCFTSSCKRAGRVIFGEYNHSF